MGVGWRITDWCLNAKEKVRFAEYTLPSINSVTSHISSVSNIMIARHIYQMVIVVLASLWSEKFVNTSYKPYLTLIAHIALRFCHCVLTLSPKIHLNLSTLFSNSTSSIH